MWALTHPPATRLQKRFQDFRQLLYAAYLLHQYRVWLLNPEAQVCRPNRDSFCQQPHELVLPVLKFVNLTSTVFPHSHEQRHIFSR